MREVNDDLLGGIESGVRETLTFFINGVRREDSYDRLSPLSAIQWVPLPGCDVVVLPL